VTGPAIAGDALTSSVTVTGSEALPAGRGSVRDSFAIRGASFTTSLSGVTVTILVRSNEAGFGVVVILARGAADFGAGVSGRGVVAAVPATGSGTLAGAGSTIAGVVGCGGTASAGIVGAAGSATPANAGTCAACGVALAAGSRMTDARIGFGALDGESCARTDGRTAGGIIGFVIAGAGACDAGVAAGGVDSAPGFEIRVGGANCTGISGAENIASGFGDGAG
jgi:hypothetical protein